MQLLQIKTVPVKYELEIESARLETKQNFQPRARVKQDFAELHFDTQRPQLRLDSYQMRRTLGFTSIKDIISKAAERGVQSIAKKTGEYRDIGKKMADIENGVTIPQIIEQKMLEQPTLYTTFLPSTGVEMSWIPGGLNTQYQEGELSYDWETMRNVMNYVPGSVRLKILEYPHVEIEYMGSPMYIPPSADPDYVEPAS